MTHRPSCPVVGPDLPNVMRICLTAGRCAEYELLRAAARAVVLAEHEQDTHDCPDNFCLVNALRAALSASRLPIDAGFSHVFGEPTAPEGLAFRDRIHSALAATAPLDAAWEAAEAALPPPRVIRGLERAPDGGWIAVAGVPEPPPLDVDYGYGRTPAEALRDLAGRISEIDQ